MVAVANGWGGLHFSTEEGVGVIVICSHDYL